ncbi:mu-type opioid receptor-like [Watersipora subatra]|uniref:mu-type opioid receptor-like n=1 Tax=Watersipora subatra TaxID=2589382 RepID=UPI00355C3EFF
MNEYTESQESMLENFTAENIDRNETILSIENGLNWTIYVTFAILGVTLNVLALVIIICGKRFSRHLKVQLTNLAVADLLCSILLPGSGVIGAVLDVSYPNSLVLCKAHVFVTYTIFYSSLLFNAAVAVEKMMAVYFPFAMLNYTKNHVIIVTACGWIVAALCQIGLLTSCELAVNVNHQENLACYPYKTVTHYNPREYQMIVIASAIKYWTPSAVIAIAYGLIAIKLCRRKNIGESRGRRTHFSRRVLVMLAANGLLAVAMWTPYYTWLIVDSFNLEPLQPVAANQNRKIMYIVFSAAMVVDCIVTPIIYVICNKDFKKDGIEIVGGYYQKIKSRRLRAIRRRNEDLSSCATIETTVSDT